MERDEVIKMIEKVKKVRALIATTTKENLFLADDELRKIDLELSFCLLEKSGKNGKEATSRPA
jgi:hypothetical protein